MMTRLFAPLVLLIVMLLLLISLVPTSADAQTPPASFTSTAVYSSNGLALVVFTGGTVEQLENASRAAGATGVWVQDRTGGYQLLVVGGPGFLKDTFKANFPSGFSGMVAVTLTKTA